MKVSRRGPDSGPAAPPNILFIVIDAARRDRFGCYGYERGTTPTIDALARESLVFDRMIATAPWTLPSHASLFTGLYAREHGADRPALKMREGLVTLGEYLAQHGYAPLIVSNNPLVSRRWGIVNGSTPVMMRREFDPDFRRGVASAWSRRIKTVLGASDKGAGATNRLIEALLPGLQTPFFLFVNYMECHWSYLPPRQFERRFAPRVRSRLQSARQRLHLRLRRSWDPDLAKDPEQVALLSDLYDASLAYVDSRVGDLLTRLARDGRLDNTIVVVTADHGEELGDHGLIGHGMHLYQSLLHVPFLARIPGRPATRIDSLVQFTDVFAGLCRLVGLPEPPQLRDRPFSGDPFALPPGSGGRAFAFAEWHQWEGERLVRRLGTFPGFRSTPSAETVQDERYKLIVEPASGQERLFDLRADPGERNDLGDGLPDVRARLHSALEEWRAVCQPRGRANAYSAEEQRVLEARLADLGYI
ncbi:MAG TPA: sulfatase [bacterium]|jgi:arylsulfatase A-like enzyme|nr:sulfatase [bacterium]